MRHVKDMAHQARKKEGIEDGSIYLRDVRMVNIWGENNILTQNALILFSAKVRVNEHDGGKASVLKDLCRACRPKASGRMSRFLKVERACTQRVLVWHCIAMQRYFA